MNYPFIFLALVLAVLANVVADEQQYLNINDEQQPVTIAIIGAGAAGSSTAYHISTFARELDYDMPINITIFETESRVGGRTTTVNALNDPRYPVELGGSIFVEVNEILFNASRNFGLQANHHEFESTGSEYDLGVWDGDSFVFTVANNEQSGLKGTLGNWWDIAKIIWKYGLSPFRLQTVRKSVIGRFLRLYHDVHPFKDLTQAAKEVDLLSVTGQTGPELLEAAGVGTKFSNEVIQASSRVNYAQNLAHFHGLETMVCMSTDGAMSIDGGNWQIFDRMVKASGAVIKYNTTVREIETRESTGKSTISYDDGGIEGQLNENIVTSSFDLVVLAAPYNSSVIKLKPVPLWQPNRAEYVSLHVTLFSSPFRPDPRFFGLEDDQDHLVPDTVLTTLPPKTDPDSFGRGVDGVGPTMFWSLSTLRVIDPTADFHIPDYLSSGTIPAENLMAPTSKAPQWPRCSAGGKQFLYKIFSPAPLSAEYLIKLFGWHGHPALPPELTHTCSDQHVSTSKDSEPSKQHSAITTLPKELVTWTHEKRWNSYPYLPPTTEFDCFDIYDCKDYPAPKDDLGNHDTSNWKGRLYYTSPIESFISTMETSALSGRNIARLIVDELKEKQLK